MMEVASLYWTWWPSDSSREVLLQIAINGLDRVLISDMTIPLFQLHTELLQSCDSSQVRVMNVLLVMPISS
jgi:hypothetical protein